MKKLLSIITIAFVLVIAPVGADEHQSEDNILIHLSSYTDNLHAVSMALKIGRMLSMNEVSVTMFLDLEGVRLADKNQPQDLAWGMGDTIEKLYTGYLEAGGKILVCPHCANAAGVQDLRDGAAIANKKTMLMTFKNANKILDY